MHYPLTIERQQAVLDGLARICGRRPVIAHAQQVGHDWAPVTRLVFDRDLSGLGAGPTEGPSRTVIVKTRRVDGEGHGGPAYLRREAAGLRTAVLSGVAARVILTDDQAGVVVQSDLGTWPTLETVLLGNDSERAATAMVDFAQTIGRLHATTLGRRIDHDLALAEFGSADVTPGGGAGTGGARRWHVVEQACAELGFPDARAARDDIAFVRSQLEEPGRTPLSYTTTSTRPTPWSPTEVSGWSTSKALVSGTSGSTPHSCTTPSRTAARTGPCYQNRSPKPQTTPTATRSQPPSLRTGCTGTTRCSQLVRQQHLPAE